MDSPPGETETFRTLFNLPGFLPPLGNDFPGDADAMSISHGPESFVEHPVRVAMEAHVHQFATFHL